MFSDWSLTSADVPALAEAMVEHRPSKACRTWLPSQLIRVPRHEMSCRVDVTPRMIREYSAQPSLRNRQVSGPLRSHSATRQYVAPALHEPTFARQLTSWVRW